MNKLNTKAITEIITENEIELCERCNKNSADEKHSCPYQDEIHNCNELFCNCCESCYDECIKSI